MTCHHKELFTFFILSLIRIVVLGDLPINMFYVEIEPLIAYKDGKVAGFFEGFASEYHRIISNCNYTENELIQYKHRFSSAAELTKALLDLQNNRTRPEFDNITEITFWFPLTQIPKNDSNIEAFELLYSESVSIVVLQSDIVITLKFFTTFLTIDKLLMLSVLLAMMFGCMFWILDLRMRGETSFIQGFQDGLWWAIVSLTSVGFGDIAPKRMSARIFGVIWMLLGLVLASLLTAFATENVQKSSINKHTDNFAVLKGSKEAKFIKESLNGLTKEYNSYNEVIEAVRSGNAELAAISSDVAAFQQRSWNDNVPTEQALAVMKTYKKQIPWYMVIHGDYNAFLQRNHRMLPCQQDMDDPNGFSEMIRTSIFKYRQTVEVTPVYYPTIVDMLTEDKIIRIILYIIAGMFGAGIIFDIARLIRKKWKSKQMEKGVETLEEVKEDDSKAIKVSEKEFMRLKEDIGKIAKIVQEIQNIQKQQK